MALDEDPWLCRRPYGCMGTQDVHRLRERECIARLKLSEWEMLIAWGKCLVGISLEQAQ
jgi:hypothetical protein